MDDVRGKITVRRQGLRVIVILALALAYALGPAVQPAFAAGLASINSGGPAVGSFVADTGFSGGSAYSANNPINTSGAANPAPTAVYQSERFGKTFSYLFSGLANTTPYVLRLHFAEVYWGAVGGGSGGVGSRVFNVAVNGASLLSNFDIYATAGGANIALERDFNVTSSTTGTVTVAYTTIADNAKSSGIELLANGPTLNVTPESAPPNSALTLSGGGFTPSATVTFYWDAVGGYQLGTATADASGKVSVSVTRPAGASTGSHTVIAVDTASMSAQAGTTIVAGALAVTTPTTLAFPTIALTGASSSSALSFAPLAVSDLRGSGVGWTLSLQTPDFATGTGRTLPFSGLKATPGAPTATAAGSSAASGLVVGAAGSLSGVDTTPGTTASSPLTLLTAPSGQGLGQYGTSAALTLVVPARAYAGGYNATFVLSVQ